MSDFVCLNCRMPVHVCECDECSDCGLFLHECICKCDHCKQRECECEPERRGEDPHSPTEWEWDQLFLEDSKTQELDIEAYREFERGRAERVAPDETAEFSSGARSLALLAERLVESLTPREREVLGLRFGKSSKGK